MFPSGYDMTDWKHKHADSTVTTYSCTISRASLSSNSSEELQQKLLDEDSQEGGRELRSWILKEEKKWKKALGCEEAARAEYLGDFWWQSEQEAEPSLGLPL